MEEEGREGGRKKNEKNNKVDREGEKERGREGGKERGREGGRKRGREGGREGGREEEREGGKKRGREGEKKEEQRKEKKRIREGRRKKYQVTVAIVYAHMHINKQIATHVPVSPSPQTFLFRTHAVSCSLQQRICGGHTLSLALGAQRGMSEWLALHYEWSGRERKGGREKGFHNPSTCTL